VYITLRFINSFHPCYIQIELGPKEFVKEVSGTIVNVVSSLVLVTNIKTYGPFGQEQGQRFVQTAPENACVVGFFGRSGAAIDAIGVYTGPILEAYIYFFVWVHSPIDAT
jgi:hypothetical protein